MCRIQFAYVKHPKEVFELFTKAWMPPILYYTF